MENLLKIEQLGKFYASNNVGIFAISQINNG